jgi:hypothetical protein
VEEYASGSEDKRQHSGTTDIQIFERRDCQNYDLTEQKPALTITFKNVLSTEMQTAIIFKGEKREYIKGEINEFIH